VYRAGSMRANPFLTDNYAPVRRELDAPSLPVIGEIPADLEGLYLRNGPNPQFDPPGPYHWFDGDGMLHGVRLSRGRASYRNRYVRTRTWEYEASEGKALWPGMSEAPRFDLPEGIFIKHTANTALVHHAGRLLALMEATLPYELRAATLETVGPFDYQGLLRAPVTAHPKVDPATGEMVFFGYQVMPPAVVYSVASPAGELVHTAEIELRAPVMMHDFAITERFTVFLEMPLAFDAERMMAGQFPVVYRRELGARIGVLPRRGHASDVRWFEVTPGALFHTVNAWEEGDTVVVMGCRAESSDVLAAHLYEPGEAPPTDVGRLHRWRLDLATGEAREEPMDDVPCDFPRIHDGYTGRPHRYAYVGRVGAAGDEQRFTGVMKYDLRSGSAETLAWGRGRQGGEVVFVPRRGARDEDDGYLLGYVWDQLDQRSELCIVDARDLYARPLARVILPQRVPFGFHGLWLDAAQLL